ncbi:MAG TPA: leucine-rich repeat domain-containing protein, partial [Prevotella sp.]
MIRKILMALIGNLIGISAWAQVTHYYVSPAGDYRLHYQIQSDGTAGITKWEVLDATKTHFDIVIPETFTDVQSSWSVSRIIDNAFSTGSDDDRITSIKFPESLKSIDASSFSHCTGLTSLMLPAQLETIGNSAFDGCTGLRGNLIIPETVKTIGEAAFSNCGFDGTLDLPDNLQTLGARAFFKCSSLKGELVLPETLTELAHEVFNACKGFTGTLKIPASVTKINYAAFNDCIGFTGDLILPDGITYIGEEAFRECTGINGKLHLPASLKYIGNFAFGSNHLSGELVLPEGLETIENIAFHASLNLHGNIKLPSSLKTLGDGAFRASQKIESITAAPGMKLTKLGNNVFEVMPGLRFIDLTDAPEAIPIGSTLNRNVASPFYHVYADVMIYLPASVGETGLAAEQENFVVGNHCSNFVIYDEYITLNGYNTNYNGDVNYKIRHAFTADKASYSRLFSGTGCKTVYLPYPAKLPETLVPYVLNKRFDSNGKEYLQFERTPGNTIA